MGDGPAGGHLGVEQDLAVTGCSASNCWQSLDPGQGQGVVIVVVLYDFHLGIHLILRFGDVDARRFLRHQKKPTREISQVGPWQCRTGCCRGICRSGQSQAHAHFGTVSRMGGARALPLVTCVTAARIISGRRVDCLEWSAADRRWTFSGASSLVREPRAVFDGVPPGRCSPMPKRWISSWSAIMISVAACFRCRPRVSDDSRDMTWLSVLYPGGQIRCAPARPGASRRG